MTNEEETHYIHQLLDIMKNQPNGYFIADEGAAHLGFNDQESLVLMRRLASEQLAMPNYGTNMISTPHGLHIARSEGGYQGYLTRQTREQQQRDSRESRSALGSFLSGWAGVAGLLIAVYTLWDAHQNSSEVDALRKHISRLEQAHTNDSIRAAAQQKQSVALPMPAYQTQAHTLIAPATQSSATAMPAHKPAR
jgi:hypothetical protein